MCESGLNVALLKGRLCNLPIYPLDMDVLLKTYVTNLKDRCSMASLIICVIHRDLEIENKNVVEVTVFFSHTLIYLGLRLNSLQTLITS